MYARNLAGILRHLLGPNETGDDVDKRFESLRGHGQLPRGRTNAAARLTDTQIASAVLGFLPGRPGWAGHVSLVCGGLRPVGGQEASLEGAPTLQQALALAFSDRRVCESIIAVVLTIERRENDDNYRAMIIYEKRGERRRAFFVSGMALTLMNPGAEKNYDHELLRGRVAHQLVISGDTLLRLHRDIEISRHLNLPLKTDWREYKNEEERAAFNARLGAKAGSTFMNLHVDAGVTWPKEPQRVTFEEHSFVLFPSTANNSQSISIDLSTERLSAEEARTLLNRFLSLLSWCDGQHAVLGDGWSGNPVPMPIGRHYQGGTVTSDWLLEKRLPSDPDLLQRLAYYREGMNARHAGLATFEVLSFFKVFESRERSRPGTPNQTKAWIKEAFEEVEVQLSDGARSAFHEDRGDVAVEKYIYDNCRVAVAHASDQHPSDADSSTEIQRLYSAAEVIHALARHYISSTYHLSTTRMQD